MRILVTNDDGVHAAGLAALTETLWTWAEQDARGPHQITVVAPLSNYSGASSAVGAVYERDQIPYQAVRLKGAPQVPAYGIDGPPALSVIVAALGAFGPPPDLVVSGINLGVNVGRSVLHSGTVGAVLTGAQRGLSGLAVSLRSGGDPPWETAATLAVSLLSGLAAARSGTVLNLNVPAVPLDELKGIRVGHIGGAAIIKGASADSPPDVRGGAFARAVPSITGREAMTGESGAIRGSGEPDNVDGTPSLLPDHEHEGYLELHLGAAIPTLGDVGDEAPTDDAALVAAGFASLTPIVGVREDDSARAVEMVERLVRAGLAL